MTASHPKHVVARSQQALIQQYLKRGRELSALIAITNLGIGSLTSRIAELRGKGVQICDEWRTDHFGRRYKVYYTLNRAYHARRTARTTRRVAR